MTDYLNTARDLVASVDSFDEIEAVDLALALGADYTEIDANILRIELKDPSTYMIFHLTRGCGDSDPAGSFDTFYNCYELDEDGIARPFIEGYGTFVEDVDSLAAALANVAQWL
ncbi:hypothetical protein KPA07_06255 [Corynebacterium aurimucosum]|uniref:hypothetical protein n=1 Tax=Corynebacterium aurimucosum TaxID=169292 RepID=UPI001C0F314C|nr:hypothetical protein [Corynebacterium aurimucosum]MBU5654514.1 hypothetical protein [Corynebacterium aurimucosum]